jgi:hypothetical protein
VRPVDQFDVQLWKYIIEIDVLHVYTMSVLTLLEESLLFRILTRIKMLVGKIPLTLPQMDRPQFNMNAS